MTNVISLAYNGGSLWAVGNTVVNAVFHKVTFMCSSATTSFSTKTALSGEFWIVNYFLL
jgi:hypothetical protein